MTRLVSEHFLHTGRPKRRYDSREEALAAIGPNEPQHVYKCRFCGGFHRATDKAAKRRRR